MSRLLLIVLLSACAVWDRHSCLSVVEKQRGMSFASGPRRQDFHYGSPGSAESLRRLKAMGVTWISITPFGFHRGTPELRWGGPNSWESDESLMAVTKQAHEIGIKVLLKPHIWGRDEAAMDSWTEEQWRSWMASYARFAEHYATLARDANVDAFCIGNEQKRTSHFESDWRAMIAKARTIYRGPITYGANFDEIFRVPFWDAVDWIGVSAYFPLVDAPSPTRQELVRAWKPIIDQLAELSKKHRKRIVFTEIGYRSSDGAAWRQWELPRNAPLNIDAQTTAYEAFFEAVWPQPWLGGVYPWKWFSYPGHSSLTNNDYELEGKPAADEITRNYTR